MSKDELSQLLDAFLATKDDSQIRAYIASLHKVAGSVAEEQTVQIATLKVDEDIKLSKKPSLSTIKPMFSSEMEKSNVTLRIPLEADQDISDVDFTEQTVFEYDRQRKGFYFDSADDQSDESDPDAWEASLYSLREKSESKQHFTQKFKNFDDRYNKIQLLGKGGMGAVWRIQDLQLMRSLAMKVIHAQQENEKAFQDNFVEEAQIGAQLQHPGIVPVYEMGNLPNGNLYFTMKEINGRTLKEVISTVHDASNDGIWRPAKDGWNFRRLISAFHAVCETMAYAHSRGVVHRDLKPANVMLGSYGEVLVVDWGSAKVMEKNEIFQPHQDELPVSTHRTQKNDGFYNRMIIGTPAYMSPEQAAGRTDLVDHRSDIYSLGSMLYQILCGENAFSGTPFSILVKKCEKSHVPLRKRISTADVESLRKRSQRSDLRAKFSSIPDALVDACDKAMARKKTERYQSVSDLALDIQRWLEGSQRREKALAVLEQATTLEISLAKLELEIQNHREEVEQRLAKLGVSEPKAWLLWEKAEQKKEKARELDNEIELLLQGALIYDPDMIETYRRLTEIEYRHYMNAVLRGDKYGSEKLGRKLRAYMEMLPREEKRYWEEKYTKDVNAFRSIRKSRGILVGRNSQKEEIYLNLQFTQLVSLVGTAGVGKTHLAIEVATRWQSQNRWETAFCDATVATDALSLVHVVGESMNVLLNSVNPIVQLGEELNARGQFLLVLDNLEQVIAPAREVIQQWLVLAPQLKILATSRTPLGLSSEVSVNLQPMTLLEGMELFVIRAQKILPELSLTRDNRQIIGRIVKRLDCLPLALELAAARVSILSLPEIERKLDGLFTLLRSSVRNSEQRALQGALDWSWDLLSSWEKSALAQCSVFRNGFDLAAAEKVINVSFWDDAPPVLYILEALCDDNLLFRERQEDQSIRYGMLASIQFYSAHKLAAAALPDTKVREQSQNRHALYYCSLFQQKKGDGTGSHTRSLIIELDNFIVGSQKGTANEASQCCLAAMQILKMKGPMSLGIELTSSFLQRTDLQKEQRLSVQLERIACLRISGRIAEARTETKMILQLTNEF